jgi:hypothetical protein
MQIEDLATKQDIQQLEQRILNNLKLFFSDGIQATRKNENEYLTREELTKILPISLSSVDNYRKKGILKAHKVGRRVMYKTSEIDKNLEALRDAKYRQKR